MSVAGPSPVSVTGPSAVSVPGPSVTSAASLMENYRYLCKLNHCKVGSFMNMGFLLGSKKKRLKDICYKMLHQLF